MNAKDAIKGALDSTQSIMTMFLSDLSDADLLVRPTPKANHIAWQIGHLIVSERNLASQIPGAVFPELPAGFADRHKQDMAGSDSAAGVATKNEYLSQFNQVRETTLGALNKLPDEVLDKPTTGQMAQFAPTVGSLFILIANHTMMHAGQFSVVRRALGKPVLF